MEDSRLPPDAAVPPEAPSEGPTETLRPPSNRVVFANAAVKGLAAGLAFALQIVLVKLLGETDYGAYVLFVTYCTVLTIFGKGGLYLTTLRYFATVCDLGETASLGSVRTKAILHTAVYSLAAVGLAQLLQLIPGVQFRLGGATAVAWLVPAVLSASLLPVVSGMLRGLRRVLLAESLESVTRPLLLLLTAFIGVYAVSLDGFSAGLTAFIVSNVIVSLGLLLLVNRGIARRRTTRVAATTPSPFEARPAVVLITAGLLSYGLFQLDTLIVGLYLGEKVVAAYAMACNFIRIVIFAALIISAQSQPLLAAAYSRGQARVLRRITFVGLRNSVGAAVIGLLVLVIFGRALLRLISPDFVTAYSALVVLSVAHLANSVIIILASMLVMCRKEAVVMWAQGAGLCVCVPLLFVLIPRMGQLGAAVSVLSGLVIIMAIVAIRSRAVLRRQIAEEEAIVT